MKFKLAKTIDYFSIDSSWKMTIAALSQQLQQAAIFHSRSVGLDLDHLIKEKSSGWVLNRIHMDVYRYPVYNELLETITWTRCVKGIKSQREFEVFSGKEKLAAASSVWILVDIQKRKIKRIPTEMEGLYTITEDVALVPKPEDWKAHSNFHPDFKMDISIRHTDYDPLGHVNNTVYFSFIETLISGLTSKTPLISSIKIQYYKEISIDNQVVTAGLKKGDSSYQFKIYDTHNLYAGGEVIFG